MIPKILLLIKQIRPTAPQINNLRAPIPILLQPRALEGAFVADADEGGGADVGVTDGAFAVAFVAEAADGYAGLFAAHDEVAAGGC